MSESDARRRGCLPVAIGYRCGGDMEGIPVALMEAMAVGIPVFLLCIAEYRNWWRLTNPAGCA